LGWRRQPGHAHLLASATASPAPQVQKCKAAAALKAFDEVARAQQRLQHGQQQQQQQQGEQQQGAAAGGSSSAAKQKRGAAAANKTEGYTVAYVGNVAFEAKPQDLLELWAALPACLPAWLAGCLPGCCWLPAAWLSGCC
jgi:hypothetical protein